MKFKDVKRGDTVYWLEKITTKTKVSNWFWLPAEVVKVTPKRFWVEFRSEGRYLGAKNFRKKDGRGVAQFFIHGQQYVYRLGDIANDRYFRDLLVVDESTEIEKFKEKWDGPQGRKVIDIRILASTLLKLDLSELYNKDQGELNLLATALKQIVGPGEKESDE